MIGNPKYNYGDKVRFKLQFVYDYDEETIKTVETEIIGTVEIIDRYGTFEQHEEVSYDIMGEHNGDPCLFKHIRESVIEKVD